jgi:hypothetical protein
MQTDRFHRSFWFLVRAGWLLVAGLMLGAFAAGVPVRLRHLQIPVTAADPITLTGAPSELETVLTMRLETPAIEALQAMGLSLRFYAVFIVSLEAALAVACAVVAGFIFWRRWDGWLTLWVSLVLILLGTCAATLEIPTLATIWPGWWLVYAAGSALGMISHLQLLFVAPDGRFVPRWTWLIAAGFTGAMLALGVYSTAFMEARGPTIGSAFTLAAVPPWLVLLGVGFVCQVYRYRRISTPVQRQQTKWIAIGLVGITVGLLCNGLLHYAASVSAGRALVLANLAQAAVVYPCLMVFPLGLGFAILRYRLWDIDLLIRRTLIYSLLTAALALVYLSSVVLLQSLFGAGQSEFVTVLSTLGIAALFVPLRRRVQGFIDRRFYRRKYDAAQTLAAFSASIRDETNLEIVTQRLAQAVEEAMQPAHAGVWLRRKGG